MRLTYLVAFLDIILCMLMVVLLMVNPRKDNELLNPPGNLFVTVTWPDDGNKSDVDVWTASPKTSAIGYDSKDSANCNLVRDDLGLPGTMGQGNFENVFCRLLPDGAYQINLHAYQVLNAPIEVTVSISMVVDGKVSLVFEKRVTLEKNHDEITVVRFLLKDGKLVPDSFSYYFTPLYREKP